MLSTIIPYFHKIIFVSLCNYVKNNISKNQRLIALSSLLGMYKTEYSRLKDNYETISVYSGQKFKKKLKNHFGEQKRIQLADTHMRNFICNSVLKKNEEAFFYKNLSFIGLKPVSLIFLQNVFKITLMYKAFYVSLNYVNFIKGLHF